MDTQTNLFEMMYEPYKITKPIRLIELFGGIGSQAKALENLNANFEHYRLIEFDKYPVASYNAIHGTNFEPKDITKIKAEDLGIVETDKYEYIMTYSFPCQDLSLAGKLRGMTKDSGTRSGLLWEVERLLSECKELPQILLMENVPNVIGKKNISDFQQWQLFLEKLGYKNYVEILNAKDYGIPQNRRRCFMISLLGDYSYTFPDKQVLHLRLKDMLEQNVDEKYFLSDKMISYISATNQKWAGSNYGAFINKDIASTLTTGEGSKRCDASNYVSDDLPDNYNLQNKQILIREATKKGYTEAQAGDGVYINRPHQKRGVVQKGMIQTIKTSPDIGVVVDDSDKNLADNKGASYLRDFGSKGKLQDKDGICNTLTSAMGTGGGNVPIIKDSDNTSDNTTDNKNNSIRLGGIFDRDGKTHQAGSVWDKNGLSPTIDTMQGGYRQPLITDHFITENKRIHKIVENNDLSDKDPSFLDIYNQKVIPNESGTLKAGMDHQQGNIIYNQLRIRKLTPKECWRLMGFYDSDFDKASKFNSNAQLYKQAGNSIVVNVLEAIFKQLL